MSATTQAPALRTPAEGRRNCLARSSEDQRGGVARAATLARTAHHAHHPAFNLHRDALLKHLYFNEELEALAVADDLRLHALQDPAGDLDDGAFGESLFRRERQPGINETEEPAEVVVKLLLVRNGQHSGHEIGFQGQS